MTGLELLRTRNLARQCGYYPIARRLLREGWSIWQTRWILFSREEYPVLRLALYLSPRRSWRVDPTVTSDPGGSPGRRIR